MKNYQSHNISIKAPDNKRKHRLIFYVTTIALLCGLLVATQPTLFATNSHLDLLTPLESIQTKYIALAERYQFLTHEYDHLQDKYAQLLAQHHENQTASLHLSSQITAEQKDNAALQERAEMLEDMNKYLCGKISKQKAAFSRLTFSLNHKVEQMQKHYETEYNRILDEQYERMEDKFQEALNEHKKPYTEYFYNNYEK